VKILGHQLEILRKLRTHEIVGAVSAVRGLSVLVDDLPLPIGSSVCLGGPVRYGADRAPLRGEVVGFTDRHSVVMLYGSTEGVAPGATVVGDCTVDGSQTVAVGPALLGRVINALGEPLDGRGPIRDTLPTPLRPPPLSALGRHRIDEPLPTGVRVIDAMLTLGRGQRIGIFSGPGVGKSTLLAMIARHTAADVNVIALIGERGKEVRDFLDTALGPKGLARSVVVVATGDESPLLRVRAALAACTVAEHFRDRGRAVLLQMDSITRLAQAQRQIGLSVGEQPATKGYTPSVFAQLPALLERAGAIEGRGSITGIYSVLVEGDDLTEPVSDASRGILDGHIALSRRLAARGHYPAVDILESISRVADDVCDQNHIAARRRVRRLIAAYAEAEELINIGAYARGSNADCDIAIALKPALDRFLTQERDEQAQYPLTCRALLELAAQAEALAGQRAAAEAASKTSPPRRRA
jgi:FliI/YscN family ATPase